MITNGRFPATHEMTRDEFGLRSMSDIDPVDLRMSSRQWELQGLTPSGKALDHGIQQCFIDIQNRCVRATDEILRLVIETTGQLPATQ